MHSSKVQEHKRECLVCDLDPRQPKSAFDFFASDPSVREAIRKAHPDWKCRAATASEPEHVLRSEAASLVATCERAFLTAQSERACLL